MSKDVNIVYEPHPVSPERKAELRKAGFKIVDARFDPERATASDDVDQKIDLGTDSGDQFSDEQLRDAIEATTGQRPHHFTGREKLIAQFNELNAKAAAGE